MKYDKNFRAQKQKKNSIPSYVFLGDAVGFVRDDLRRDDGSMKIHAMRVG